jgi:hypothetical protein
VETEMQERKSGFCRDVNASFLLVADVGFKFLLERSKLQHTVKIEHGTREELDDSCLPEIRFVIEQTSFTMNLVCLVVRSNCIEVLKNCTVNKDVCTKL